MAVLAALGLSLATRPVERWGVIGVLGVAAYPLFWLMRWWVGQALYGSWYQRERALREVSEMLAEAEGEEELWCRVVRALVGGLRVAWVCVLVEKGTAYGWDAQCGAVTSPPGEAILDVPVQVGRKVYGRLLLGAALGRDGIAPWERRWVETMARLVAMRLAWWEQEAEVKRLRAALAARQEEERAAAPCPLSKREIEILTQVAAGKSDREIADAMLLSVRTVETHMRHIHAKLGVRNRTAAVAIVVYEGWIEPPAWYRGPKGNP